VREPAFLISFLEWNRMVQLSKTFECVGAGP
jgi:hypothetical protein